MFAKIISTGSYLPSKIMTNEDISKIVDTSDEWIVSRTGIKQRHIVADNETTSDLSYQASLNALKNASIDVSTIDAIIVATTTPDLTFPSTATILQKKLGLKGGFAFDVQAVCSGFMYGLTVADSLIITGKAKRILLVGAESMSKIINWEDRNTCVLFGVGAGAFILESTLLDPKIGNNPGILGVEIFSDGQYVDELKTTMGVSSGNDIGSITMNGQEVFKHAVTNLAHVATLILNKYNLKDSDINWFVPHQANLRIITSMAKKLNLSEDKIIITVDKHANTSGASIPLALDYGFQNNKLKKGDLILTESMGAGFTWGAGIIRL